MSALLRGLYVEGAEELPGFERSAVGAFDAGGIVIRHGQVHGETLPARLALVGIGRHGEALPLPECSTMPAAILPATADLHNLGLTFVG